MWCDRNPSKHIHIPPNPNPFGRTGNVLYLKEWGGESSIMEQPACRGFIALQCFTLGSFLWLSTSHSCGFNSLTNLYCKLLWQEVFLSLQYLVSYLWIRKLWQFRLLTGCFGFYWFKHKSLGILVILLNNNLIESSLKSGNVAFWVSKMVPCI